MKKIWIMAFILLVCGASVCLGEESFTQRIRRIDPGMDREEVLTALGEPEGVVQKFVDQGGRLIEVWRYVPATGSHLLASQRTIVVPGEEARAEIAVPRTADRVQNDTDFWKGVQDASVSNPADPLYKPTLRKLPPSPRPAQTSVQSTGGLQVYFITFADGIVQNVSLEDR